MRLEKPSSDEPLLPVQIIYGSSVTGRHSSPWMATYPCGDSIRESGSHSEDLKEWKAVLVRPIVEVGASS